MSVLLLESGDAFLRESGTQRFLLESSADPPRKTLSLVAGKGEAVFTASTQTVSLTTGLTINNAALADDDLILVVFEQASSGAISALTITDAADVPYAYLGAQQFSDDIYDTNMRVGYKRRSGDNSFKVTSTNATNDDAGAIAVYVIRNVDWDVPFDNLSIQFSTGIDTTKADPPAVTPKTTGAWIIAGGAAARAASSSVNFTHASLSSVVTQNHSATVRSSSAVLGLYTGWTSGAYDPAAFAASEATSDSWVSFTLVVRPDYQSGQDIAPSLLANTQTFYAPAIVPGAVSLAPALVTNSQTFYSPAITTTVGLLPGLLTNDQTFYSPTVSQGLLLEPSLFTNSQTFFAPTVSVGPVTLEPALLTNSQTFYAPALTTSYTITPGLLTNGQTFYGATVSGTYPLAPPLLTNDQTFYGPTITLGAVTITPPLLTNAQTFYAPALTIINNLQPSLLTNSQTFYAPTVEVSAAPFDSSAGIDAPRFPALLVEIDPLDPADGTRKTIRATNVNDHRVTGLNDLIWRPAISENARFAIRLFKGDFDGTASPAGGNLSLQIDQLLALQANARRFVWVGASVKIWSGRAGDAWPWDQVFEGLVGDNPRTERNRITLPVEVNGEPFEADVLTLKYAGTGDEEGGADLKDKPKPWLLGRCFNAQPVLINATDSVFQFSAYGVIEAVTKLYERGSDFGASFGDYADYAALVAAAIPAGRWGTCLAEGMVRLGAPPAGVITGDVDGDKYGGTWRRKTGEIILRVATNAGASAVTDTASLSALDTAVATAAPSNQGRIGVYLTDQESLLDFAARLASPCNAQAGVSLMGELFVSRIAIGGPTATLDAQQRQMPRVTRSIELGTSPPFSKIEMGYARSWRVHSTDEISYYAELIERGRYDAATFYREGNIIDLEDGSRWVYINAVPGSGNAPPTWPTTSNAYWDNLSPPLRVQVDPSLSPGTIALEANRIGTVISYAGASSTFSALLLDGTDVSSSFTFATASGGNPASLTVGYVGNVVTITGGFDEETSTTLTIEGTGTGVYTGIELRATLNVVKNTVIELIEAGFQPPFVNLPASNAGTITSYAPAVFSFKVRTEGGTDISNQFTLAVASGGNPATLTVTINNSANPRTVTVSGGLTAAECPTTLTIEATGTGVYAGMVLTHVIPFDADYSDTMLAQLLTANDQNGNTPTSSGQSITSVSLETLHPDGTVTYKATYNWTYDDDPAVADNFDAIMWCYVEKTSSGAVTLGGPSAPATDERNGVWWVDLTDLSRVVFPVQKGDPTKYYTFGFAKFRKVATSVDPRGYIYGPITQYGPFQPSSNQNITADINSVTAANVALGANAANAGLNTGGTVKANKVDTSAIIASSVTNSSEGKYTGFGTLSAVDTTNLYCIFEHNFTGHGLPIHVFAEAITKLYTTTDATAGDIFTIKLILTRSLASNPIVSMQDGGSLTSYASHISGGAVALTPNVAVRQYQHFGADATIDQGNQLTKISALDASPPGSVSSGVSLVYGLWFGKTSSAYGDYVAGIEDRIAMAILETMR